MYMYVYVNQLIINYIFCRKRRSYIDDLKKGKCLTRKTVLFSHSSGNSGGTLHFVWKVPCVSESEMIAGNADAVHKVQPLPHEQ